MVRKSQNDIFHIVRVERRCGAGVFMRCGDFSYWISMNCGQGTNTIGELLALWCLQYFAKSLDISHLQLLGNSRVVMDRFIHKANLQVVALDGWKHHIRDLEEQLIHLPVVHIFRGYNKVVDTLSKEAVCLEEE